MKTIKQFAVTFLLMVAFAGFALGQTSLTQTTLAAAVGAGPVSASGGAQASYATTVNLTSATGVQTAFLGTQPVSWLYVDQELFGVISLVTGQTTVYNVLRAQQGTKAAYHASGAMVLIGTMSPQFGGFAGSGGFQVVDPPVGGVCNLASTGYTPWVNVVTAAQWQCTSTAGSAGTNGVWAPGWNNPLGAANPRTFAAVASATTTTPSGPLFHLTGTTTVTTFGIPIGFNATSVGGGEFCYVADGASGTTAGNNIGATVSHTANGVYCWYWDQQNSKFYPVL